MTETRDPLVALGEFFRRPILFVSLLQERIGSMSHIVWLDLSLERRYGPILYNCITRLPAENCTCGRYRLLTQAAFQTAEASRMP